MFAAFQTLPITIKFSMPAPKILLLTKNRVLDNVSGNSNPDNRLKQAKLKSAVRTTHGGVLRDLNRHIEALKFGDEAHALLPGDFRPCTLMGALNIELGEIGAGHEWYGKAEERGAKPDVIDSELRSLIARMTPEQREKTTIQLLKIDPVRYGWIHSKPVQNRKTHVSSHGQISHPNKVK